MDSYKDKIYMKNVALWEVYNFIAHHIFIWSHFNTEKNATMFQIYKYQTKHSKQNVK